jgi:hypothetical protein
MHWQTYEKQATSAALCTSRIRMLLAVLVHGAQPTWTESGSKGKHQYE